MAGSQPSKDQRTEKPTGRRKRKALQKGKVPRSPDVGQTLTLAVFLGWAAMGGAGFIGTLTSWIRQALANAGRMSGDAVLLDTLLRSGIATFVLLAPLMGLLAVTGLAGQFVQGGFHPRKPMIEFELAALNPINGLKNFINFQKLLQAGKAIIRTAFFAILALLVVVPEWPKVLTLSLTTPAAIWGEICRIAARILTRALVFGLFIAVIDYALVRWHWFRGLYMTKQEIRDEHKESEGNPQIKRRQRMKMIEAVRRRMMMDVRKADVVVTNPTHVAVALKYDRGAMGAPRVLAKGKGFIALKIKEEAAKYGVPILEDPPLARTLERLVEIGHEIPEQLYRAVAEVLAFVMGRKRGPYRTHDELERELEVTP